MFNALVLNRIEDQKATGEVKEINISDLPEGDVLVKIDYSTINYKDSLAITSSSLVKFLNKMYANLSNEIFFQFSKYRPNNSCFSHFATNNI